MSEITSTDPSKCGICPKCDSGDLYCEDYGMDQDGQTYTYIYTCRRCGSDVHEVYNVTFDSMTAITNDDDDDDESEM